MKVLRATATIFANDILLGSPPSVCDLKILVPGGHIISERQLSSFQSPSFGSGTLISFRALSTCALAPGMVLCYGSVQVAPAFSYHGDWFGHEYKVQLTERRAVAGSPGKDVNLERGQSGPAFPPRPSMQLT